MLDSKEESEDQELEAHYVYLAKIQEVITDADTDNGPIFDKEALEKVHKAHDGKSYVLINFVEKFMGKAWSGNYQFVPILGCGEFCDADLEVAFKKSTCFVLDFYGNDLLTGNRESDLYTIELQKSSSPTPISFMARSSSSQAWLWHRRLSHLNFNTINLLSKKNIMNGLPQLKFHKDHLYSSCELGKAKCNTFKSKTTPSSKRWLHLLHMDLCGPIRVENISGKKYILVIVDDYLRYKWTLFLRSKEKTPKVLINFLRMIQRGL
ncbi:retrovirus-related pol polyprotein from transposon TNT 1-94 [Tanacetum coccineum]